eukprot:34307_1
MCSPCPTRISGISEALAQLEHAIHADNAEEIDTYCVEERKPTLFSSQECQWLRTLSTVHLASRRSFDECHCENEYKRGKTSCRDPREARQILLHTNRNEQSMCGHSCDDYNHRFLVARCQWAMHPVYQHQGDRLHYQNAVRTKSSERETCACQRDSVKSINSERMLAEMFEFVDVGFLPSLYDHSARIVDEKATEKHQN